MLTAAALLFLAAGLIALWFAARARRAPGTPPRMEPLQALCLGLALLFLGLPFVLFLAAQITFALEGGVDRTLLPLGLAGSALLFWTLLRRDLSRGRRLACIGLFLALVLAGLWLGGVFFDTSYDGKAYHQEAVLAFLDGLNPLIQIYPGNHWVDDYPKLSWVLAAALAQWTPSIQNAKGLQALFLCAGFFGMLRLFLNQGVRRVYALAGAVLLALNPVVLSQFFTFYVDGPLYGLLAVLLGQTVVLARARGRAHSADAVLAAMSGALLANLKFTGLVYAGVALFCLCGFCLVYARRTYLLRAGCLGLAVLCLGLGLGASPYLHNLLRGYHIFHPLMGEHKGRSIIEHFRPPYMSGKNPLANLIVSNFSRCEIVERDPVPEVKNPFDFPGRVEEFQALTVPDPRVGGFGPYMGAILVFSGLLAGVALVRPRRVLARGRGKYALLLAAGVLGSTLINPEAWWARYAPQFWMLWSPLLLWLKPGRTGAGVLARGLALGIVLVCGLTIALTARFVFEKQSLHAFIVRDNLVRARAFKEPTVYLLAHRFALSTDRLLSENGFSDLPYSDTIPQGPGYLLFFYEDHGFLLFDQAEEP